MKTILATTLGLLMLGAPLAARDLAATLLQRADTWRGGFDSAVLHVKLTNYEKDRPAETAEFEVSAKGDNSLVKFLSVRSKGQSLLMRGDDMWFFLPAVARPVRITPIQRLMGNVSNGDLARLRYAADYDATLERVDTVDGEGRAVLDLRARRRGATYQRIRFVVREADGRPLFAEYFLASGKPVKTATFGELRTIAGRQILTRIEVLDTMRPSSRTVIDLLSITPRELPDKLFNPARSGG
ncbi:MAG TPA: outer membrane lipoprotein-sorting protein [Vicinamibacterales bacterium]|nr:outer membrane lipoprotein-sorting protein [Vicinamibacterales bacterium]